MGRNRIDDDTRAKAIALRASGETYEAIAARLKIGTSTVFKITSAVGGEDVSQETAEVICNSGVMAIITKGMVMLDSVETGIEYSKVVTGLSRGIDQLAKLKKLYDKPADAVDDDKTIHVYLPDNGRGSSKPIEMKVVG